MDMAVVTSQLIQAFLAAIDLPEDATFIRIPVGIKGPIEVMSSREHMQVHTPGKSQIYHLVRRDDPDAFPTAQTGMDIGQALQEALGLPRETTYIGIELDMQREGIATVNCYYYPNLDVLQRCQDVLRQYRVAAPEDTTVPQGRR
jgi:hypothetical protein